MPSHYETLNISEDADDDVIKKAYRSLSFQYHPDRYNGPDANEKMQAINEAYEVLKDDEKRAQYNDELHGIPPRFQQGFPPGFPPGFPGFNLFEMMMGGGGGSGINIEIVHGPGGQTFIRRQQSKPPPIQKHINITYEQAYTGVDLLVEVGDSLLDVKIPKGINEGHVITFAGKGIRVSEQLVGDAQVVIHLDKHPHFIRKCDDLYYKQTLSLKEALCGASFNFVHLNGKKINLHISNTIIYPGATKCFKGYGFNEESDMVIEFDVKFPESLSDAQKEELSRIL